MGGENKMMDVNVIFNTWEIWAAMIFAALLAMLFRFWDFPTNTLKDLNLQVAVLTFVGALIAAFFAVWMSGLDPTVSAENFLVVGAFALGGMGAVRGLFEVAKKLVAKPTV